MSTLIFLIEAASEAAVARDDEGKTLRSNETGFFKKIISQIKNLILKNMKFPLN